MGRPPLRASNEQTPTAIRRLKQNLNGAAIVGLIVFVFVLFYVLYWARIRGAVVVTNERSFEEIRDEETAADPPGRDHWAAERLGAGAEADHFMQCPGCDAWIDMRDLGMVLDHAGPLPHPVRDRAQ